MQFHHVKLTLAASWMSLVGAAQLAGDLDSLPSWTVLIGIALPSLLMMQRWNHPGRNLSESIQEPRQ